ncbi:acetyltransferase [Paenibacillus gorillae]|uniref:acetyltransferase n=1 Tax=Paenibacillus gorillae TaxID=1243662 RepID=UPI0004B28ADB|nr:acetyltransferase [Paenibacillus gorillae]
MNNKPIIILGGGGHAKVCIDLLMRQKANIIGYTALQSNGLLFGTIPHLGDDTVVDSYNNEEALLVNGVGMVGDSQFRSSLFERFRSKHYAFATLVHDSAVVSHMTEIEEGAQIMAGAVIQAGSIVGKNTIINTRAVIDHDCRIGDHSHVSPGAVLCGQVTVGQNTHIGAGATIIQHLSIGSHVIVGAGSLVRKPVPDRLTVYGIPAEEAYK